MICSNCGKNNVEGSAFCEDCGTPLTTENIQTQNQAVEMPVEAPVEAPVETPAEAPVMPAYDMPAPDMSGPAPEKKVDNKTIITIVAAVAVVVILIFGVSKFFGGGYKKPIDQYFDALNSGKAETLIKAAPKGQEKEWAKDDDMMDELEETLKTTKESYEESYEDEVGDDIKFKYKVIDSVKMTKDELEEDWVDEMEDYLEEEYYDKEVKVSAGYRVALKITLKGKNGSKEMFETVNVYKINGHWCIDDEIL